LKTTRGLKQGFGLSPTLFNIYLERVFSDWNKKCRGTGLSVENKIIQHLLFAGNQTTTAEVRDYAEYMAKKLTGEEYQRWGLNVYIL
jgi:hypothetical protein